MLVDQNDNGLLTEITPVGKEKMELLIVILLVLIVIAYNTRRKVKHAGITARRCPHCKNLIPMKADVCEYCHRDVPKEYWIWESGHPLRRKMSERRDLNQ